jgi:hypothetical protein
MIVSRRTKAYSSAGAVLLNGEIKPLREPGGDSDGRGGVVDALDDLKTVSKPDPNCRELDPKRQIDSRTAAILASDQRRIFERADRLFAGLTIFEWVVAIMASLWISLRAGSGTESYARVWTEIYQGGVITLLPLALVLAAPGKAVTRHVTAAAQMLMSGLLLHLTGGRIETHLHIFGVLAFLSFYRDWRVLVTSSIVPACWSSKGPCSTPH